MVCLESRLLLLYSFQAHSRLAFWKQQKTGCLWRWEGWRAGGPFGSRAPGLLRSLIGGFFFFLDGSQRWAAFCLVVEEWWRAL